MDRTGSVFEGWNIGAVSVKRVRLHQDRAIDSDVRRPGGAPASTIRLMLDHGSELPAGAVVTGCQSASLLPVPYLQESICIEAALGHLDRHPDLVHDCVQPLRCAERRVSDSAVRKDEPGPDGGNCGSARGPPGGAGVAVFGSLQIGRDAPVEQRGMHAGRHCVLADRQPGSPIGV